MRFASSSTTSSITAMIFEPMKAESRCGVFSSCPILASTVNIPAEFYVKMLFKFETLLKMYHAIKTSILRLITNIFFYNVIYIIIILFYVFIIITITYFFFWQIWHILICKFYRFTHTHTCARTQFLNESAFASCILITYRFYNIIELLFVLEEILPSA